MLGNEEAIEALPRITPQWLAGFFDGDGSVTTWINSKKYASAGICLAQKDIKILTLISLKYNGVGNISIITNNHGSKCGVWQVRGFEARIFLRDILPYVIIKKRVVEKAIELMEIQDKTSDEFLKRRIELFNGIRELNKEGNSSGPVYKPINADEVVT